MEDRNVLMMIVFAFISLTLNSATPCDSLPMNNNESLIVVGCILTTLLVGSYFYLKKYEKDNEIKVTVFEQERIINEERRD